MDVQDLLLSTSQTQRYNYINKSTVTNLVAVVILILGYVSPLYNYQLKQVGLFALSGAITNWLAIYMLFERIPGLYGSGIIPNKFQEFKLGIHELIMHQFFTRENITKFLGDDSSGTLDLSAVVEAIDYDKLFDKLVQAIEASPMAGMLAMVGGGKALESVRPSFTQKMKEALTDFTASPQFQGTLKRALAGDLASDAIIGKVNEIVNGRLEELTPDMVKNIIQNMIRTHLGWLVVWGGVFGGLIGLVASYIS